jgi:phytanoyl-CoA hydroxylase
MEIKQFKEEFEENGYVILRNFIPSTILKEVQKAVENLVEELAQDRLEKGLITESFKEEPFNNRFKKLYENDQNSGPLQFTHELQKKEFFKLYSHPPLLKLVQSYLGDEVLLLMNVVRIRAFPNEKYRSMWHQDSAYLGMGNSKESNEKLQALKFINCWAPLVPVNKNNGCMEFVPGTHKLGVVNHVAMKPNGYLHVDPKILNPYLEAGKAVDIELNVGDIVLFHNFIFHQGQENYSGKLRWNADFRFRDARQNTLSNGHYIVSAEHPEKVVSSGEEWADTRWQ